MAMYGLLHQQLRMGHQRRVTCRLVIKNGKKRASHQECMEATTVAGEMAMLPARSHLSQAAKGISSEKMETRRRGELGLIGGRHGRRGSLAQPEQREETAQLRQPSDGPDSIHEIDREVGLIRQERANPPQARRYKSR